MNLIKYKRYQNRIPFLVNVFLVLLLLGFSFGCKRPSDSSQPVAGFKPKSNIDLSNKADQLSGGKNVFMIPYDKFDNTTTVGFYYSNPAFKIGEISGLSFDLNITFPGRELKSPPEKYNLIIRSYASEWRFLESNNLIFIVDGIRIVIGAGNRKASVSQGLAEEKLTYQLSEIEIDSIANAKSVELRVGEITNKLNSDQIKLIKKFLTLVND